MRNIIQLGALKIMRNEKRIKNKKVILISISIILVIVIIGGFSIRHNIFGQSVAEAVNVVDTIGIIKVNNPINKALKEEIKSIEKENADIILEQKIKIIEEKRLADERIAEIERLIALGEAKILNDNDVVPVTEVIKDKEAGKIAYLTFDDGPSKVVTPQVLDILKEYNIKATFFVIGSMAEKSPELLKRIYEEGHTIGNHTFSHIYAYIYKNSTNFINDLEKSNETFRSILGQDYQANNIMRFPGGSFGSQKKSMIKAVVNAGYRYFDWNSLNGDAEGLNLSKEILVNRFIETTKDKKELIVLMHDTDIKYTTVESLSEIIEYLIDNEYTFGVLDEY